jgi:tRNA-(ms[2]io[6]A)-hydroxylase
MRILESDTPDEWVEQALEHPGPLLLDHLQCEMKAATVAQSLITKNPNLGMLVRPLIDLAHEELAHYRLIHELVTRRGVSPEPIAPSPYMQELRGRAGRGRIEPLLDRLLEAALVEARSCERFHLLASAARDGEIADLFRDLVASEARHAHLYVDLSRKLFDPGRASERLTELARIESDVLAHLPPGTALHSGWHGLV